MRFLYFTYVFLVINTVLLPRSKNMLNIGFGNLDILEIWIWFLFVIVIYYLLLTRLSPLNKLNYLLSEKQRFSFIAFTYLFIISLILGVINKNEFVVSQSRGVFLYIITFIVFIVFLNFSNKDRLNKYVNNSLILLVLVSISVIFSYFSTTFNEIYNTILGENLEFISFQLSVSGDTGTYSYDIAAITTFVYFFGLSKILFNHRNKRYYIMTFVGLVSTNIFFHKPVVVAFLIGNILTFLIYFYINKNINGFLKILKYTFIVLLLIFIVGISLPDNSIQQTIAYFEYGWLNMDRTGVEDDLSTGRFTLWMQYGSYALNGFGLALWGFGKELIVAEQTNPHNFIVFLSYNMGIISVVTFLFFLISILLHSLTILKKQKKLDFMTSYSACFAIIVYLMTLIIQSQYSGILDSNRTYIFMFSSLTAILLYLIRGLLLQSKRINT